MAVLIYYSMDYHRQGLTFVADLSGVGWNNLDVSLLKNVNSALMDRFPLKITNILILNPPGIFKTVITALRLVMKAKVINRIKVIKPEDLTNYIDEEYIPTILGGKLTYTNYDYIDYINTCEEIGFRAVEDM
eukprot:TRINITY_DN733_c0_g1_i1.p1 TRINITY_DN733_c0_g1~~TRINITY_DN733_c0_g1_i1.p1  ORF type:complete len:132 (+),score=23.20 TRINITY_DN733_c0_g1_i1:853-1248(+)